MREYDRTPQIIYNASPAIKIYNLIVKFVCEIFTLSSVLSALSVLASRAWVEVRWCAERETRDRTHDVTHIQRTL